MRVLVASQDPAVCESLQANLHRIGFMADVALGQALRKRKSVSNDYGIVFVDLELLPDESIQALRQSSSEGYPILIGIAPRDKPELKQKSSELGLVDVLELPLNFDALYESICSLSPPLKACSNFLETQGTGFRDQDDIYTKVMRASVFDSCCHSPANDTETRANFDLLRRSACPLLSMETDIPMADESDIWFMVTNSPITAAPISIVRNS